MTPDDGKPGPVRGLRSWRVPINGMALSEPQLGPRSSQGTPCLRGGFSLGTAGGTKPPVRAARGMGWREDTQPGWHLAPHPPSCPVGPCTAPSFQAMCFIFAAEPPEGCPGCSGSQAQTQGCFGRCKATARSHARHARLGAPLAEFLAQADGRRSLHFQRSQPRDKSWSWNIPGRGTRLKQAGKVC